MPLSAFGENAVGQLLSGQLTKPATWYIGLHTAAPPTTGNESTGSGYARQSVVWTATLNALANSGSATTFTAGAVAWGGGNIISTFGVWDASTAGNCWWYESTQQSGTYLNASAMAINAGGSGYIAGDVGKTVNLVGGTSTVTAQALITAVAGGLVTGIKVATAGNYSAPPADPAATTGGGTTGTGLTITSTWKGNTGSTYTLNAGDQISFAVGALVYVLF